MNNSITFIDRYKQIAKTLIYCGFHATYRAVPNTHQGCEVVVKGLPESEQAEMIEHIEDLNPMLKGILNLVFTK